MDLVFCGTPQFAVPTLEKLVESGFRLRLVLSQPDRPSGRGLDLAQSPVKQRAAGLGLPILQPDKIKNNQELRAALESLAPDAIVVVGYGRIIPPWMIAIPRFGNLNLHASLLPEYRGAAPVQWAIARGETVTGVTTMRIDPGLDTGDILLQKDLPIAPDDTAVTLAPRLAEIGAGLMVETLRGLLAGSIQPVPQDHSRASLAPLLKKEDGLIDFRRSAREIGNRLRGFQPWPGAWTSFRGKHLQVHAARPLERFPSVDPGTIVVQDGRLMAGCGQDTGLELLEVQLEGKKRMSGQDFLHGHRPQPGELLGAPPPAI
ncbi:MAG TPA: methionyl-tRNA formyltransferase [Terriglobales bacterium]|jgi:methionyl-tRNA formyltransferase|nr:methionyl-tRNA formyltransferase [Terriglobales bacterium]